MATGASMKLGVLHGNVLDLLEDQTCTRLPYHDGPCNGYRNKHCELKHRLEREGKLMITKPDDVTIISGRNEEPVTIPGLRGIFKQAWAWITGRL